MRISVFVVLGALATTLWFGVFQNNGDPDWKRGDWSGLIISAILWAIAIVVFFVEGDDDITDN